MFEGFDFVKKRAVWVRFWDKVKPVESGCWEWQASTVTGGYGQFGISNGFNRMAHRVAWTFANGEIPEATEVCHQCDNRKCCRPRHLFLGSRKDNMQDMVAKRRGKHSNKYEWDGATHSLTELYSMVHERWPRVSKTTFYRRIYLWGIERAMTSPGRIK